jgi:hypothetical protein
MGSLVLNLHMPCEQTFAMSGASRIGVADTEKKEL